jgi:predicted nucleotidyltransferase
MSATTALLPEGSTARSRANFSVAVRIADGFQSCSGVTSVSVGGSTVRGVSDRFSDLDVYVYCLDFPPEEERQRRLAPLHPRRRKTHADRAEAGVLVECFECGEVEVDLNFVRVRTVEACLIAVLEKHQLTPIVLAFVGGFADAIALSGQPQHDAWQARVRAYPELLARKLVAKYLPIEPLWVPGVGAEREGDRLPLYDGLCRVERQLLWILIGLNRGYPPPAFKRVRSLLASLPLKPDDMAARLEAVFDREPDLAIQALRTLVLETFDLVQAHMPELDVPRARRRFTTNPALADESETA